MKLYITPIELLSLISDTAKYEKCDHNEFDSCCYLCQVKRVDNAQKEGELVIDGNDVNK